MVTKQLSSDFMQQIADEQAWKELSRDFCWTETLLDKYQDRLDWSEVVENRNIQWTIPMVQKFKNRIDWKTFSCYADEKFLTEETLEVFKDKWDWNELSDNSSLPLTEELLEKFIDRWNWKEIISYSHDELFENSPIEFYEKYKEHIAALVLHDSELWRRIVEKCKNDLRAQIIA
ncbi:hypothetical protein [Prevotella sp.]|uniref:hypothetical protein n=1 Tax=Prevotella sp. TaxID=59823 RepID=UPI002F94051B